MVAMARYIILDIKELTEVRVLAVSAAILLLTIAVLVIRYGHTRFPTARPRKKSGPATLRRRNVDPRFFRG
jgi:protein PsiE